MPVIYIYIYLYTYAYITTTVNSYTWEDGVFWTIFLGREEQELWLLGQGEFL